MSVTDKKRGFRWGRLVMWVSLALNLLVVGVVGGTMLNRAHEMGEAAPPGGALISYGPYTRALNPEDRKALRGALMRNAPHLRANRREVRQDFDRLLAALRAQPFDKAAAQAVLDTQQGRVEEQARQVRLLVLDQIAGMSDAERAAFADRLEAALRRGPPRPPRDTN